MEILDCDYGELACLIGNREFLRFPFERNPKFVRAMMGRVLDFYDCIQNDEPPEVDATYSTAQTLAALHPDDNGETVTLEPLHVCWVTELERLKADIKKLEEAQALMQNRLREAIGDNTFACADGVAVTLKTQERKGYLKIDSDKRALVEAAGVPFAETKPSKFRVMRVKKEFGK
jgi:predicted phage-related endonuclease